MKTKRILCLVLALLLVMPLLVACKQDVPPAEETGISIVADGESSYSIVYSDAKDAAVEKEAAQKLQACIAEKTGVRLNLKPDTLKEGETEILVGKTNRAASGEARSQILARDFVISYYEDGKVVILGGTAEATARAVDYFVENFVSEDGKSVTVSEDAYFDRYDYILGQMSVNGVALTEYNIVYPEGADKTDLITYYIAINIYDYILAESGAVLDVVSDKTAEQEYEILVGDTNREESVAVRDTVLADDEYLLFADGTKIVMMGNSYMVGGAASEFFNNYFASQGTNVAINVTTLPTTATPKTFTFKKATSAILMVGDGMGFNHIKAAVSAGNINEFVAEQLPFKGSSVTKSQSVIDGLHGFTDSAAAATALATGYKTYNGSIGVDKDGTTRLNVRELANSLGANTAVLTTDKITGATPAGFLCHSSSRGNTEELMQQINALLDSGDVDYAKGSEAGVTEKQLINHTREALYLLAEGDRYFAMIEEAHIDKHSHNNDLSKTRLAVAYYNETIAYTIGFVMLHPDTALVITADHECGGLTESFVYTSDDHTNVDVPIYGLGDGVDELIGTSGVENTEIAKFLASIFGAETFGQQ